jgi:hypothetical protein
MKAIDFIALVASSLSLLLHFIVEGIWFLIAAIVVDIWAASRLFGPDR